MATVFLDTETTGLDDDAQVVEIAVVDEDGSVLFESYCRPTVPVDPGAQAVHGIGPNLLAGAPTWPEIADQVRHVLDGNEVVIFNAEFDTRILIQTAAAHGDHADWVHGLATRCAMYRAADVYGATNRYGTISLVNAAARAGIQFQGRAHSAAGDAATTAALWRKMAE
jgi:DNA polymerase III epsilon subunit-like protein